MPDISMCDGKNCKKKEECYRFTAVPSSWQSYFSPTPDSNDGCKYFMQDQSKISRKRKNDSMTLDTSKQ